MLKATEGRAFYRLENVVVRVYKGDARSWLLKTGVALETVCPSSSVG